MAEELPNRIRFPHLLPERSAFSRSWIEGEAKALRGSGASRWNDFANDPWPKEGGEAVAGSTERRTMASIDIDNGPEEGTAPS